MMHFIIAWRCFRVAGEPKGPHTKLVSPICIMTSLHSHVRLLNRGQQVWSWFVNILLIAGNQVKHCKISWCMDTEGNQIQPILWDSWHKSLQLPGSVYFTELSDPSLSDRARHNHRAPEYVLGKQSNSSRFHKYLCRKACKYLAGRKLPISSAV